MKFKDYVSIYENATAGLKKKAERSGIAVGCSS